MCCVYINRLLVCLHLAVSMCHTLGTLYHGASNTCSVENGNLFCWGDGSNGILGTDDTFDILSPPDDPIEFVDIFEVHSVSIGHRHICAVGNSLHKNGTIRCWGACNHGRCGYGHTDTIGTTNGSMAECVDIDLGPDFVAMKVAAAADHSCALSFDGEVRCFGQASNGQLGTGQIENDIGDEPGEMGSNLTSVDLGDSFKIVHIALGHDFGCALSDKNAIKCWGTNHAGQLGQGDTRERGGHLHDLGDNLSAIDFGNDFIPQKLAVGETHVCSISSNGTVKCFGSNEDGQLGMGDTNHRGDEASEMGNNLSVIDLGTGFIAFDMMLGSRFTCISNTDYRLKCFGENDVGELGLNDLNDRGDVDGEMGDMLPFLNLGANFRVTDLSISGGEVDHSCACDYDRGCKCWGYGLDGELGYGTRLIIGDVHELDFIFFVTTDDPTEQPTNHPTKQSISRIISTEFRISTSFSDLVDFSENEPHYRFEMIWIWMSVIISILLLICGVLIFCAFKRGQNRSKYVINELGVRRNGEKMMEMNRMSLHLHQQEGKERTVSPKNIVRDDSSDDNESMYSHNAEDDDLHRSQTTKGGDDTDPTAYIE